MNINPSSSMLRRLSFLSASLALLGFSCHLVAQPTAPTEAQIQWLRSIENQSLAQRSVAADTTSFSVSLSSRAEARAFYNALYPASDNVPIVWTGSLTGTPGVSATGQAGTTSASFKDAVKLRINWFRAMAGIPAGITFNDTYSAKAQEAALMMSANNALSHNPPTNWLLYTANGAEAAGNSNIAVGWMGPGAIAIGYMCDPGSNNAAAGHRRWLLYPQTKIMGTGDVSPGNSFSDANATWIMDSSYGTARPAVRDNFVAWPPKGYVPYPVVYPRWSISYPGADFSSATVAMTRNGSSIQTALEPITSNVGESTLVWVYDGIDAANTYTAHAQPSADTVYTVKVSNVLVGGVPTSYDYSVTVFDPAKGATDDPPTRVTGPTTAGLCTVSVPTYASGFQWREMTTASFSGSYGAEGGLQGVETSTSSGYNVVDTGTKAEGSASYHLAHISTADQSATLPGYFTFASGSATLNFKSRLGWASSSQVAKVQISVDDGVSWVDLYSQAGSDSSGEHSFVSRSVAIDSYAGRTFRLRFAYTLLRGGTYFPQSDSGVGWYIDSITLANASTATPGTASAAIAGSSFPYTIKQGQSIGLQARTLMFGYPTEWGYLNMVQAPVVVTDPGRLIALGLRGFCGTDAQELAAGYILSGSGSKRIVIRGVGPGLIKQGVTTGTLVDPLLKVTNLLTSTQLGSNDNWSGSDGSAYGPAGLDSGSKDSVLFLTQAAGNISSARVSGNNGGTGEAMIEVYDTEPARSDVRISALSVSAQLSSGQTLIPGLIIGGSTSKNLIIRALGPALQKIPLTGYLPDPKMTLYQLTFVNGSVVATLIATNDNWSGKDGGTIGLAPRLDAGSKDAVIVTSLAPGNYTLNVTGNGTTGGLVMVEIYEMP